MHEDTPLQLVDSPAALEALCAGLADAPWLALDTEFVRERTYYPRLCLIQVATPERVAVIDPLALPDLEPLLAVLYAPGVRKVLHAASQDLEILAGLRDRLPANLFDTQLAAPLLGYREQIGYGELVEALLGVHLEKGHARTDWSRRPLDPEQLRYAADDVRYLAVIYPLLHERLEELGRLEWLAPELAALEDVTRFRVPPEASWRRIRGATRLRGRQRAALQSLAAWRERVARAEDIPRGWVVKDDVLADLARAQPRDLEALGRFRGLGGATLRRHGAALLEALEAGRSAPPPELPAERDRPALDAADEALVDLLGAVVRHVAAAAALDPSILAQRRDLERLACGDFGPPVLEGWRERVVGGQLRRILAGESVVAVRDGRLVLAEAPPLR